MEWSHVADKTNNAIQFALGLRTLEEARTHSLHRPVQSATLVHRSVRPLEGEALQQVLTDLGDMAEKLTGIPAGSGLGD
jgi:hypothetical protein